ncbi:hypothetical protein QYF61_026860 [Mycteria americana]|uniref:Reverse transcriptase domain-containing protein n=1 Tax=Mycteria americana TaxID=33587 RepID=A0AAN7NI93_MYCAM|nr:hypothetical protein QYF61_026860 [Mycteria americana]
MSLSTSSKRLLNTPRDGDSTTSPGSLFQCWTTLSELKLYQYIDDILIGDTSPEKVGEAAAAVWQALQHKKLRFHLENVGDQDSRMANGNPAFMLLFQTLTMLLLLTCGQRALEWPWSQAHVKYTGSTGIHSSNGDLNLSTVGHARN